MQASKLFLLLATFSFLLASCKSGRQCECKTYHDNVLQSTNNYNTFTDCSIFESEYSYPDYEYKVICEIQ